MGVSPELQAHLDTGCTTLAHAWAIMRTDGVVMGFTDHDRALEFDGVTFRPDTGLSAMALEQSTGLSVDNTEALGALSDGGISEADIDAGRFDGAEVVAWRVNWADVAQRVTLFRGHIGEIRRSDGAFRAEVRGLSEALNRPTGRVFQKPCAAVLGDGGCRFELNTPGYSYELAVDVVEDGRVFRFDGMPAFEEAWFKRGRLAVLSGDASGLSGGIKRDRIEADQRVIELWEPIRATIAPGDQVRLEAGCDKRFETCRLKFGNVPNFQGFPDIPEDDWVFVHPGNAQSKSGGSRR